MTAGQSTATRGTPYISDGDAFQAADLDSLSTDLKTFLEANMAGFTSGTYAARPAAAAGYARWLYWSTDALAFFWCDGAAWLPLYECTPMTTTARDSLPAGGTYANRVIINTTTGTLQRYNAGWADLGSVPESDQSILAVQIFS